MTAGLQKYAANVYQMLGRKHSKGGRIGTISPLWTEDGKKTNSRRLEMWFVVEKDVLLLIPPKLN